MSEQKEFQTFNSHNKRWIHFRGGKIRGTSKQKFSGVPVKGEKKPSGGKKKAGKERPQMELFPGTGRGNKFWPW